MKSSGAVREGPGRWEVEVPRSWWAWLGPQGGLLNALAARAAADLVDGAPRATHAQFLRSPSEAPISFVATLERAGRTSQFVTVRGIQDGMPVLLASFVFARSIDGAPVEQRVEAPAVPRPEDSLEIEFPPELVPFGQQFVIRYGSGGIPMSGSAESEMAYWFRLQPAVPVDALVAIVLTDVMPPGIYPLLTEAAPIVSAELSVHLHVDLATRPVDDDVLVVQRNVTNGQGWCVDEADLWDRNGVLLAQSRQLRRVLTNDNGGEQGERAEDES
ncbi:thioesterase family protein [Saccharopolyspora sp. K220]|uniref:acyl-CoA thioesterase n=1 Tax=Saccharopolyspora soli TaxID=2926618 RepID=UPI001F596EE5|nr:thioesterase family protein [Saccharopolyspora soli]MCI2416131.1 thioesterase family protein [Saccharopolyspora soli]